MNSHTRLLIASIRDDHTYTPTYTYIHTHTHTSTHIHTQIITSMNSDTRLLVASIRDADSMATLAAAGCDTFTFSPEIAVQLTGICI
jgi:hypothetical protein